AQLKHANGDAIGTATFTQDANGVRLSLQFQDLQPGTHGIHIHTVGTCDASDFSTAGGHFNPTSAQHGLDNPSGPHAGDLPNLEVPASGSGTYQAVDSRVSLGTGANSLFDADGSALVIHAGPDDNVADPAGNSGARIACGTIAQAAAGAATAPATQPSGTTVQPVAPTAAPAAPIAAPTQRSAATPAPSAPPRTLPRTGDAGSMPLVLAGLAASLSALGVALSRRD
ncbi:MAG: superoxide dismutase family protein, partial [Chloroflexi bacterium]|nr:superoxide dismutase family protein [Chloroflexota bacterium]